jgi:hypothetical protein
MLKGRNFNLMKQFNFNKRTDMKTAWFLSVSQPPVGLRTTYITIKTRSYHIFLPYRHFRTEQEALLEASSLIQATLYAKIIKGSPLCSYHPAYGTWTGGKGETLVSSSPFLPLSHEDMKNVSSSLAGLQ